MIFSYDKLQADGRIYEGRLECFIFNDWTSLLLNLKLFFTLLYHIVITQLTTSMNCTSFPRGVGKRWTIFWQLCFFIDASLFQNTLQSGFCLSPKTSPNKSLMTCICQITEHFIVSLFYLCTRNTSLLKLCYLGFLNTILSWFSLYHSFSFPHVLPFTSLISILFVGFSLTDFP